MKRLLMIVGVLVAAAGPASAQKPKDEAGDKGSAKALMQSGLKLYAAKDYLGALAVFKDAYARFPSGKILLNIGTTLRKLDRKAEAANAYQRYLDSPDADPTKHDETVRVIAELDKDVGLVELTIEPSDAEVQVGDGEWQAAADARRMRVTPGNVTVHVRREKYRQVDRPITTTAGAKSALAVKLELIQLVTPANIAPITPATPITDKGVRGAFEPAQPRSRFGVIALAHIDPSNKGAAGVVGLAADVGEHISVRAAAILGPYFGGYVGASYATLTGRVRPIVAVALPVFRSDGWRVAVRGAGGIEVEVNRHLSLIAELGVEYLLNPQDSVDSPTMFIPAVGVSGRL